MGIVAESESLVEWRNVRSMDNRSLISNLMLNTNNIRKASELGELNVFGAVATLSYMIKALSECSQNPYMRDNNPVVQDFINQNEPKDGVYGVLKAYFGMSSAIMQNVGGNIDQVLADEIVNGTKAIVDSLQVILYRLFEDGVIIAENDREFINTLVLNHWSSVNCPDCIGFGNGCSGAASGTPALKDVSIKEVQYAHSQAKTAMQGVA